MAIKREQKLIPKEDIAREYQRCQDVDVSIDGEAQRRGYAFQDLLYSVLKHEGLEPRASYKPKGEEIDGSFYLAHMTYLLEAKWVKDPISASSLFSFKGKVDGKLLGTLGIFISMSGFYDEAPEALTRGKVSNIILFDQLDMDTIFTGRTTFTQILDFKMRQAGETGKSYVPYMLPETVQSATSKPVFIPPKHYAEYGRYQEERVNVLLLCEGQTDTLILETLFSRLLDKRNLQQNIAMEIINMGGIQNWAKMLPEIVNIKLSALDKHLGGIIVILDSNFKSDSELIRLKVDIRRSVERIAISAPVHVTFVRPDIEGWIGLDKREYKPSPKARLHIAEKLDSLNIDHFVDNNPEMQAIAHFLNSLVEEEVPLWESDAIEAVKTALEEAEWDDVNNTVTLPSHEDKEPDIVCRSLEELKYALNEIAVNGAANSMPFEGGEAVFELDYDFIVQEILIDYYSEQIEKLGWQL